jgi:drug/metabolite transporter (DMT)-like permease
MIKEGLVLLSEVVLSLYPTLIKTVDTSVFVQTGLRMLVFTVLALITGVATGAPLPPVMDLETLAIGVLNLLHVSSSYTAFEALAGGNAMSLFYMYPITNILGASVLLGEKIDPSTIPWLLLAFFGALAVAQPSTRNWSMIGVVAALLAALTETGIYLWFKHIGEEEDTQPWTKMTQMYGSSGVLWLIGAVVAAIVGFGGAGLFKLNGLGNILGFNALVGFVGYGMRFYLIPNVSTVTFSAISFFGIISAYIFGWIFSNEVPSMVQALGAGAIIAANAVLLKQTA